MSSNVSIPLIPVEAFFISSAENESVFERSFNRMYYTGESCKLKLLNNELDFQL